MGHKMNLGAYKIINRKVLADKFVFLGDFSEILESVCGGTGHNTGTSQTYDVGLLNFKGVMCQKVWVTKCL